MLVVDSIQTIRAAGTDQAKDAREKVDVVVRALKAVRDRYGFLVIATCELSRGAYRSRSVSETINDLAAFKESGGIEYAAQTALVLRSVPEESNLVDITVPKNRAFKRNPFRLRMDHRTTSFTEVDAPSPSSFGDGEEAKTGRVRKGAKEDAERLAGLILRQPGIGERDLRAEVKRLLGWGIPRLDVAKRELGGRLVNKGGRSKSEWHIVAAAPDSEGSNDD